VHIKLHVDNSSTKKVEKIKVQLIQTQKFYAYAYSTGSTHNPDAWKQTYDKEVPPKSTVDLDLDYTIPFVVPSISKPFTEGVGWAVGIVFVEYKLMVRLDVPFAVDLEVKFPVHLMGLNPRWPLYYVPQQLIAPPPLAYYPPPPAEQLAPPQFYGPPPAGQVYGPLPSAPALYPPLPEDYKYPVDNEAIIVELGNHQIEKEDEELLDL